MSEVASKYDFVAGEVLLVHKPLNWTSFDVVNKLRYTLKTKLGIKKIKVGHAGTLDPLADGLLIICTGKKTKSIDKFMVLEKVYSGTITFGATTPSYDLETEIDQEFPIDHITEEMLVQAAKDLTGEYDQYPPIFSAKKHEGQRAYDLARAGERPELKPKKINIAQFDLTEFNLPKVNFYVRCSKGTYIRSLAHDIGQKLKSGAHLSSLRREAIGQFDLKDAKTVEEWIRLIEEN